MTLISGTPSGCVMSAGSLAGGSVTRPTGYGYKPPASVRHPAFRQDLLPLGWKLHQYLTFAVACLSC